ncbi:BON domain-containing protein [Planctomicrobium sp. SH664]|uniref:BON domain-containing protein n=1 Tax=Planctomicrobium sp. SH664 TaxID=3448125 RepID=UPI003F5BA474
MRRPLLVLAFVPGILLLSALDCSAQSLFGGGGGGSSGAGGSGGGRSGSGGGSGMATGGSIGSGSSSGSGGGSSRSGSGGSNRSGNNSQGGAQAGIGNSLLNLTERAGDSIGQNTFVGRSDNTSFVGRTGAASATGNRGRNNGLNSLMSALSGADSMNGNFNQNGLQNQNTQRIKPQLQLGFSPPEVSAVHLNTTLQSRMASIPTYSTRLPGVNFAADDSGTVTLTGTVSNDNDRRLAETLIRMEPGVRDVKNELKVRP